MNRIILLCLTFITFYSANGQTKTDSLQLALKQSKSDTAKISVQCNLSDVYFENDPDKALEYAVKAIDLCKNRPADRYSAKAYLQASNCYLNVYEYDKAFSYIDKAITIFEKLKSYPHLVEAISTKGRIFDAQANYPKSLECFNKALQLAETHDDKNGISLAHLNLGLTYSYVDNTDKAFYHLSKSIETDSILNNKSGIAKAYNNLGILFNQTGDYAKSLYYYSKAYEMSTQLNNTSDRAKNLSNIGNLFYETGDYRKALSRFFQSIKIKEEISDLTGIANSYNNIGGVYVKLNKLDSTIYYFQAAINIYLQVNDKRNLARTYANLGSVYQMTGKEKDALLNINKSIDIRRGIGDIKGEGHCYMTLCELYTSKHNLPLALQYINKSLTCAEKANEERLKMDCFQLMSSLYEKMNNPQKALLFYQKYHAISDTIYNHQKQKLILELETKYETAEKDNQIKILNNTNEINQLHLEKSQYKLRQQQTLIAVIGIILLLSAGFGAIYYRLFKQKQKINHILEEQNEEIEQQNYEISTQRDYLEALNKELEVQKQKVTNQRDAIEAELKKTLLASEILHRENIQFKYEALKSQLNPHFLFNTFSTLISLISESPVLAEQYTRSLSNVYRYILAGKDKELAKLKEEIDFIDSYMFLISIRFDDNVKIEFNIASEMLEYHLPLLSLQLLIENAVKHNIISERKPLLITVENVGTTLIVSNNLQKKTNIVESTKIGLQNIINRYELIGSAKVAIEQSETHFTVKLPLIKANKIA